MASSKQSRRKISKSKIGGTPMKLNIHEKLTLYAFGCPNFRNTVSRLKMLTALAVDPEAKHKLLLLTQKVENETDENEYVSLYLHLRSEMDLYFQAKRKLQAVEQSETSMEDVYEAD
jgi:hypothetical protein